MAGSGSDRWFQGRRVKLGGEALVILQRLRIGKQGAENMLQRWHGKTAGIDAYTTGETAMSSAVGVLGLLAVHGSRGSFMLHVMARRFSGLGGNRQDGLQFVELHLRAHGPGRAGEQRQPEHQEQADQSFHGRQDNMESRDNGS